MDMLASPKSTTTLFPTLQGLGNSIIQWPVIESLKEKTDLTLAVMNNGSSKFYNELGYDVVEINSRKDIILKLGLKKYDTLFTPCPTWKRECLASLVTLSNKKFLNIHRNKKYSSLLPTESVNLANPEKHDIENTVNSLGAFSLTKDDIVRAKEKIKERFRDKISSGEKYVVMHPTASTEFKFYPKKFWVDLAAGFSEQGYSITVISGPSKLEADFCIDLVNSIPKVVSVV